MATLVRKNVKVWQGRAQAGFKVLRDNEHVDGKRLAAIGYCFGGSTALQLAYSGADLSAVVTFHAALPVPDAEQAGAIKAKLMICHGALDKFIPEETILKFRAALESAKVDYQMIYFGGAVHSFSVPGADKHNIPGIAYNGEADRRSWRYMQDRFGEVFGKRNAKGRR
jgi:dienelactone hydrolase